MGFFIYAALIILTAVAIYISLPDVPEQPKPEDTGITAPYNSNSGPIPIVYGTARLAGNCVEFIAKPSTEITN